MIVFISLGSNIDAEKNIRSALTIIKKVHPEMVLSPMYQTSSVGFDGDDFLNCVARIDSDKSADDIYKWFRIIEVSHGRDRKQPKFSSRSLDIDMLTFGDQVIKTDKYVLPRGEIGKYAFVLKPLSDVAPDDDHPILKESYLSLWKKFNAKGQEMHKIEFSW